MSLIVNELIRPPAPEQIRAVRIRTISTNGEWGADYTAQNFTEVYSVTAIAVRDEVNTEDRVFTAFKSEPTTTFAEGYALRGQSVSSSVLGPTIRNAPDGTQIIVSIIGV